MGKCWNCESDVFLKDEETRCDNCKVIVRYWCWRCQIPFDVEDKETKKKVKECKWCGFFICPSCRVCAPDCQKIKHLEKMNELLKPIIKIDSYDKLTQVTEEIIDYFEDIKLGKEKTTCAFGVPKTYAKERIKQILARMKGFKVKDAEDVQAFEKRREETLYKEEGCVFTIKNTREPGSYGQEYRDVFNLCVCLGKLKYKKKHFKDKNGLTVGYDSWTRIEEAECPFLNVEEELVVKYCPKCKKVFSSNEIYCNFCVYTKGGKKHEQGSRFELKEKLSNIPTCKNLQAFKSEVLKEDDKEET